MRSFWGPRLAAAIAAVCLLAFPGLARAQYTTVTTTALGGTQTPVTGTIYWQTVVPARIGSSGGQMVSGMPAQAAVTSGASSLTLPDAELASPNVCYAVTVIDGTTGSVLLGQGLDASGHVKTGGPYGCVQPTGASWSFDSYQPNSTAVTPSPTGGTVTGATTFNAPVSFASTTSANTFAAELIDKGGFAYSTAAYSNSPALAYAASGGGTVFLPCGTTNVSAGLSISGAHGSFLGANSNCNLWNYTGTAAAEAVLNLGGTAGSYVNGNRIANLQFGGNSHLTYGLEGKYLTGSHFENLGSNGATSACFYFYGNVADTYSNLYCSSDYLPFAVTPQDAIVFDGGVGAQSTTSTVISPTAAHASRYGINLADASNMALLAIQTGGNGTANVYESSNSWGNLITGLLEGGTGTDSFLGGGFDNGCFLCTISGKNTHLQSTARLNLFYGSYFGGLDGSYPHIQIDAGAYGTVFRDVYEGWAGFNDAGHDTRIDHVMDNTSGKMLENFPQEQMPLPNGSGSYGMTLDNPVRLAGFWYASGSTAQILSTDTYTTGKAWRAIFQGEWIQVGIPQDVPSTLELNETSNTVTCGGATLTVSVNGSGNLQMYPTSSECGFIGQILFFPDNQHTTTAETTSLKLRGGAAAKTLTLTGCAVGTYALADGNGCGAPVTSGTMTGSTTTATHTFSTGFSATPDCAPAPEANVGAWFVSSITSAGITVTYTNNMASTWTVMCRGEGGLW